MCAISHSGRLDVDRDAGEQAVLAGVVDVKVAIDDRGDVVHRDPSLGQDIRDTAGLDAVVGIELVVAEPEPGVEQQHATTMPKTAYATTTPASPA